MSSESVIHCVQDVHVKELVKRLSWSVKIRWYYISISSLLIVFVYLLLDDYALNLRYDFLIIANVFLFFCNILYEYQLRYSYDKCLNTSDLRYYLILQIITDYLALTLVVYTLGSIETPIILMIIPNTILATLFFTPRQSLVIVLSGLMMVLSPLILEFFQLIPIVSIFDHALEASVNSSLKTIVLSEPVVLFGYVFILFICVVFCWYLLCSITSRLIKNELQLERSYQDMIRLDEEKTHATLRSTHELKAPLAAIKNYVYTMNEGYAGEINAKALKIIDRIGKRCDYLLDNVTDIIKLGNLRSYVLFDVRDNAQGDSQLQPINLVQYMEKFVSKNRTLTYEKQLTVGIDDQLSDITTGTVQYIMANEENLQLIFSNVFINAINYSHANGVIEVIIRERKSENKMSENNRSVYQNQLCVSIKDHGIGIDKKQIENVFEEHFRANNAVKFYEGGTGLGLSIVKVCSQILDADVQIESSLGQGTMVSICFKSGEAAHE